MDSLFYTHTHTHAHTHTHTHTHTQVPSGNVDKMDSLTCQLCVFSTLVTGSLDGQVRLWNINTRSSLYTCHLEPKNVVTFSERVQHSPAGPSPLSLASPVTPANPAVRNAAQDTQDADTEELKRSVVSEKEGESAPTLQLAVRADAGNASPLSRLSAAGPPGSGGGGGRGGGRVDDVTDEACAIALEAPAVLEKFAVKCEEAVSPVRADLTVTEATPARGYRCLLHVVFEGCSMQSHYYRPMDRRLLNFCVENSNVLPCN